jgi:bacteriorhodopsin
MGRRRRFVAWLFSLLALVVMIASALAGGKNSEVLWGLVGGVVATALVIVTVVLLARRHERRTRR